MRQDIESTPEQRALFRSRFPGIDAQIGRAVAEMADYHAEREGRDTPSVRGWVDVRRTTQGFPGEWIADIYARLPGGTVLKFPVIPDAFNPHPDKLVRAEDPPHVFTYMTEAERAADEALGALLKSLREQIGK